MVALLKSVTDDSFVKSTLVGVFNISEISTQIGNKSTSLAIFWIDFSVKFKVTCLMQLLGCLNPPMWNSKILDGDFEYGYFPSSFKKI